MSSEHVNKILGEAKKGSGKIKATGGSPESLANLLAKKLSEWSGLEWSFHESTDKVEVTAEELFSLLGVDSGKNASIFVIKQSSSEYEISALYVAICPGYVIPMHTESYAGKCGLEFRVYKYSQFDALVRHLTRSQRSFFKDFERTSDKQDDERFLGVEDREDR